MGELNNRFIQKMDDLLKPIERLRDQKLKLILHAGTPKTGTTSLQTYLGKKQYKLRGKGILYPHNLQKLQHPTAPKHQWFEKNLITNHEEHFLENIANIIAQINIDTHTIILSSEGIYNYWWDFPVESKQLLSQFGELFDTQVWVWFREPLEFIESYYKQCIRNPQIKGNSCYGKNLSFAQMLDINWFSQHLNYQGFMSECQTLFGKENVSAFEYRGDVVQEAIEMLGLSTPYDNPTPRKNESLNNASIRLLRTINQYNLKAKDKEQLMPHIKMINEIIDGYQSESLIDQSSKEKTLELHRPVNLYSN